MRESRRTECMHLPKDSTELWLESQVPQARQVKHANPPEDSYETWVRRRVQANRAAT